MLYMPGCTVNIDPNPGLYMSRMQHGVTRVKTMGYIEPDPGGPIWLSIGNIYLCGLGHCWTPLPCAMCYTDSSGHLVISTRACFVHSFFFIIERS